MRGTKLFVVGTALCLLFASPAAAAPGAPDPSFGTGGYAYGSFAPYDRSAPTVPRSRRCPATRG